MLIKKMNTNKPKDIDEYIKSFPKEIQEIMQKLRNTIIKAAPKATEKISYAMPAFYQDGNLVYFAAYKNHIGFYPTSKPIAVFKNKLTKYKTSKGAIQFPIDKPLPLELITQIVKFRVQQNSHKIKPKKK